MKIAVITPYYKEQTAILRRCHLSVMAQETSCRHFLVADGHPNETASAWDCEHITLSSSHADNGNTPRTVGALSAINLGYEAVLFLDADNWYTPHHVSEALALKTSHPEIDLAVLSRQIVLPDGTHVDGDREDETRSHIDTSCYCFFTSAFGLIPIWGMMPPFLGPICDRIMYFAVKQKKYKVAWSSKKTCYFTSNYRSHYILAGQKPPKQTNDSDFKAIADRFRREQTYFYQRTGLTFKINYEEKPVSPQTPT